MDTNASAKWAIMEMESKTVSLLMNVSLVFISATNGPLVSTHRKATIAVATKVMKEMDSPVRTLMNAPATRMTATSRKMLSVLTPTGRTCVLVGKVSLGMGRRVPTLTSVRLVLTTASRMPSALIGREVSPANANVVSMETQQRNALVSTVTSEYAGSSFRIFAPRGRRYSIIRA